MNQSVIDRSLSLNLQQNKLKLAQISIKLQASEPNFFRQHIIIQSMNINIFWQSLLAQLQLYSCHLLNKQKSISSLINLKLTLAILKVILILCNNDFFQNITLMQAKSIFKNDFTQQQLNVKNAKVPINFEIPLYSTFKEYYQNSSQISRLLFGENNMDIKYWIICGTNQGTQGLANLVIDSFIDLSLDTLSIIY